MIFVDFVEQLDYLVCEKGKRGRNEGKAWQRCCPKHIVSISENDWSRAGWWVGCH